MAIFHKPATLARAVRGVFFGTINHLVGTFNWMVSALDNLKAGSGVKIENLERGAPKISLDLIEGECITIEDGYGGGNGKRISVDVEELQGRIEGGGSLNVSDGTTEHIDVKRLEFLSGGNVNFTLTRQSDADAVEIRAELRYV